MPWTGEWPGKGVYTCTTCGRVVVLDDDFAELSFCRDCHGFEFLPWDPQLWRSAEAWRAPENCRGLSA